MVRNWFYAKVIDNQDPLNLGRVRAASLTLDNEAIRKAPEDFNPVKDAWSEKDPFIYNSLLPLYVWAVPKNEELIQIYYHDSTDSTFLNAYYIQGPFSRIQNIKLENYLQSQKYGDIRGIRQRTANFVRDVDGNYKNPDPDGVFPDPGDVGIMGRGTTDVICRENDVLLRAGKYVGELIGDKDPIGNKNRAFIQLSKFDYSQVKNSQQTFFEVKKNNLQVKFLIEYNISTPENVLNLFKGTCRIYRLLPNKNTLSDNIKVDSNLDDFKYILASEEFDLVGIENVVKFINDFIQTCNKKNKTKNGVELFSPLEEKFPIYFRPTIFNYNLMTSNGNDVAKRNLTSIFDQIKLNKNDNKGGYGLIYERDKVGTPIDFIKKVVNSFNTTSVPQTYAAMGGNKVYLLSQYSQIPGKEKINFSNSLYGFNEIQFSQSIEPNTSSMVRGEELMELLNYIIRFLTTHTHSFPGRAPTSVTEDGSSIENLTTLWRESYSKVLNQYIRLN